jgi:hypothetical protein
MFDFLTMPALAKSAITESGSSSIDVPTGLHALRKLALQRAILLSSCTTPHREAVGETRGERCEH